jgi:hypothetical protein
MSYKIAVFFTKLISIFYILLGFVAVTYPPIAYLAVIFFMIAPMKLVALAVDYKNIFLPEFHSIWANELSILLSLISIVFGILMYFSVGWIKQGKTVGRSIVNFMLALSTLIVVWNICLFLSAMFFPDPTSNNTTIELPEFLILFKDIIVLLFEYWLIKTLKKVVLKILLI